MLRILVTKEIADAILDLRFVITTLLCLVLIPLGMYVSRRDYERRLDAYRREHQQYRQRYGTGVEIYTEAQGLRPPSVLSIFSSGVDPFLPDKMTTARSGLWRTIKQPSTDNPHSLLFGKADLLFNVVFVLSLAAMILTFNSISGERESGTLALMIAGAVPRSRILLSKVVGNYVALLIPFTFSMLISLIVLDLSPDVSILSREVWPAFLLIVAVTLVFLLGMVCLGLCLSALTRHPMNSIVLALFAWAVLILGVPKVSPMLAGVLYPIESASVYDLTRRLAAEDIDQEMIEERESLRERCFKEYGAPEQDMRRTSPETEAGRQAKKTFEELFAPVAQRYERRLADELGRIDQDHARRRQVQFSLATDLSRISPICSYTYVVCGLCGTGTSASDDFTANAQRYQDQVKQAVYDKVVIRRWRSAESYHYVDGFDLSKAVLPEMRYTYPTVAQALRTGLPDVLLLFLFDVLFCALAFLGLNRYDVR
jgi:ABC-type transport system involved in multi-copper enzyme maturation permease subunit